MQLTRDETPKTNPPLETKVGPPAPDLFRAKVCVAQGAATNIGQPMIRVVERQKGVSSRESPAANVYPQDELRGVNKDHQELSRATKSTRLLPPKKSRALGVFSLFAHCDEGCGSPTRRAVASGQCVLPVLDSQTHFRARSWPERATRRGPPTCVGVAHVGMQAGNLLFAFAGAPPFVFKGGLVFSSWRTGCSE